MIVEIPDARISWRGLQGVIEASTAGLPPGRWPEEVIVLDAETRLTFRKERTIATREQFYGVAYRARYTNESLHILND